MARVSFRMPAKADMKWLARNLRVLDRQELQAVCDLSPYEAVVASCKASDQLFLRAWFIDGWLVCISGCSPVAGTVSAAPWLLGTGLLDRYLLSLRRLAKASVQEMLAVYPILSNVIDARQVRTIRWLQGLGFVLMGERELKQGYALMRFSLCRD